MVNAGVAEKGSAQRSAPVALIDPLARIHVPSPGPPRVTYALEPDQSHDAARASEDLDEVLRDREPRPGFE